MLLWMQVASFALAVFASHLNTASAVNVLDYGADPTGTKDSTAAFHAALQSEGTMLVDVPHGTYTITAALNITGQALQGLSHGAWGSDGNTMSLPTIKFHPFGLPGSRQQVSASAFVLLGGGGAVHGLNVEYQWGGFDVQPVPPCIQIIGHSGPRVTDMRIQSAWDGISSLGTQNAGRYYLANLFIVNSHNYGIAMSEAYDYSTMDNIEVWITKVVTQGKRPVGTGILIHGVDGLRASNLAVFQASVGVLVTSQPDGRPQHKAWASFSNLHTDKCAQGMVVEGSGNMVTLASAHFQSHQQSLIVNGSGSSVRVSATRFKSNGRAAVEIHGSNTVTITGSGLHRVFPGIPKQPALNIAGEHSQTVLVTGCDMEVSDDTAIMCDGVESSSKTSCAGGSVMLQANFIRKNQHASSVDKGHVVLAV